MLETRNKPIPFCVLKSRINDLSIINNYDIYETPKQIHSIPTTSTPNHHAQRIAATSVNLLNLHTTTTLSPVGKEYMCFQKNGKTAQAAKCIKSRMITKVVYYVLLVDAC